MNYKFFFFLKTNHIYSIKMKNKNYHTIKIITRSILIKMIISSGGGQGLSFYVGLKTSFTSKSTSEEEETFGKTP